MINNNSQEGSNNPPHSKNNRVVKEIKLLLTLNFFGIVGLLARKGLTVLTTYDGAYLKGVIWANFTGSFIMGLLIQNTSLFKELLQDTKPIESTVPKKSSLFLKQIFNTNSDIPIYVGLTTGLCGSITTFSSMMTEAFLYAANIDNSNKPFNFPNGAYGIMDWIATLAAHMSLSLIGLMLGKHLMRGIDPSLPSLKQIYRPLEMILIISSILSTVALLALSVCIHSWREWTISALLDPFGVFIRYYVSKYWNKKIHGFPLGTFFVNVLASLLLAIFILLQRGKTASKSSTLLVTNVITCQVLGALGDGFCGGLSTISTFVVELTTLKLRYAYRYFIISIITSFIMVLVTLGSYNWTRGLGVGVCA